MAKELMIFGIFVGLAFAADWAEGWLDRHYPHHHEDGTRARRHVAAWMIGIAAHPSFLAGAHEFVVHIVVYSGKVIAAH